VKCKRGAAIAAVAMDAVFRGDVRAELGAPAAERCMKSQRSPRLNDENGWDRRDTDFVIT